MLMQSRNIQSTYNVTPTVISLSVPSFFDAQTDSEPDSKPAIAASMTCSFPIRLSMYPSHDMVSVLETVRKFIEKTIVEAVSARLDTFSQIFWIILIPIAYCTTLITVGATFFSNLLNLVKLANYSPTCFDNLSNSCKKLQCEVKEV